MKETREYQQSAIRFLTEPIRRRGFIIAPAGSGKTHMAASAAKRAARPFWGIHVIVNTTEQKAQMKGALDSIGLCPTIEVRIDCAAALPDTSWADLVLVDEAHHLTARTWAEAVMFFEGIVWGFSATPWTGDWERDGILKAFFGEENFIKIDRNEVKAAGGLSEGVVIMHDIDQEGEFDEAIETRAKEELKVRKRKDRMTPDEVHLMRIRSQLTIEHLKNHERRNAKVVELANASGKSTLVLIQAIAHGELLQAQIPGSLMAFSKMGAKKRKAAIDSFRSGETRVLIATSLADEGLDTPRAEVLIVACGGRSSGKSEQRSGRVMRPFEGKEQGVVHDFIDRGAKLAFNQSKRRRITYKRLGYQFL